jgi:KUP system potassium uptake protein
MGQWLLPKKLCSRFSNFEDIIKSLGLVFGDIGTSPIYTLSVVFLFTPVTLDNVLGVCSLIIWTLTIIVFMEYAVLAMGLSKKGEGGTIVLKELLIPMLKSKKQVAFATMLSYVGISLLCGDGVLTPAMSVLSAVEGLQLIPSLKGFSNNSMILFASFIAVILFMLQKRGADRVSAAFGPLMLVWFIVLSVSGFNSIMSFPYILKALNPYCAIKFIFGNGFSTFFVFSGVILCATGGEALYADMGHLGCKPIRKAGVFVFVALLMTYLGQGAYLLGNTDAKHVLCEMIYHQAQMLYIPFIILCLFASIIASQAMISSIFSVVYQGITTKILPAFKVDYTSSRFRSQIYVGFVNWFLLAAVLSIIFQFKASYKLAAAYGFAVTGTMTVTGIMMTWIFCLKRKYFKAGFSVLITCIDFLFLISNTCKIPSGGYWSVLFALIPLSVILLYTKGQKKIVEALNPMDIDSFVQMYNKTCDQKQKIEGTALFFVKQVDAIAPYISQTMFKNNIIYEDNIIVSLTTRDDPFGVVGFFKVDLSSGLRIFEIHMGYMEIIDIEKILNRAGINAKVIFYGLEDINTKNLVWKAFAFIKRIAPTFVQFYKLPPYKLHGVVTVLEI